MILRHGRAVVRTARPRVSRPADAVPACAPSPSPTCSCRSRSCSRCTRWFPLIQERYLVFLSPWVFLLASSAPRRRTGRCARSCSAVSSSWSAPATRSTRRPAARSSRLDTSALRRPGRSRRASSSTRSRPWCASGTGTVRARAVARRVRLRAALREARRRGGPPPLVRAHGWDYYTARGEEMEGNVALDIVRLPRLEESPEEIVATVRRTAPAGTARVPRAVAARDRRIATTTTPRCSTSWAGSGVSRARSGHPPDRVPVSWGIRVAVFTRS